MTPTTSRRDTTHQRVTALATVGLFDMPGSRRWVQEALALRVVESRDDVRAVNDIWMRRHYLARQPTGPRVKRLSYLGQLGSIPDAVAVTIALQGSQSLPMQMLRAGLDVHPCSVLELVRCWRADDLTAQVVPRLMITTLRRIVAGGAGVRPLAVEWCWRKLDARLNAPARILLTYADPAVGHDGALYLAAGAVPVGRCKNGKLAFAWPLDPELRAGLARLGGSDG